MAASVRVRRGYADDGWYVGPMWEARHGTGLDRVGRQAGARVALAVDGMPSGVGVVVTTGDVADVVGIVVPDPRRHPGAEGALLDALLVEGTRDGARWARAAAPRRGAEAPAHLVDAGFRLGGEGRGRALWLALPPGPPDEVVVRTTRDSVAMGDDATAPHRREHVLAAGSTVRDLVGVVSTASVGGGSTWAVRLLDAAGGAFVDRDHRSGRVVAVLAPGHGEPVVLDDTPLPPSCRVHLDYLLARDPREVAVEARTDPRGHVRRR